MTEQELIQILLENGTSSLVIIVVLIVYAKSKYKEFRDALIGEVHQAVKAELENLRSEVSTHSGKIESTEDEVRDIRATMERTRDRIARLEGKLGITDSTPPSSDSSTWRHGR